MDKDETEDDPKVVVAEFKVSMHCNACERTVAKAIAKCKGVERFTTDMNRHMVAVTGQIDPKKIMKKLKKKTGKRVEIVENDEKEETASNIEESNEENGVQPFDSTPPLFDCCVDSEVFMMFSDENPNACSVM